MNFEAYIAEFVGTFLLMLLINGIVANVSLEKSGMKGAGSLFICIGCGFAVMLPCFIFGAASGAHLNPALSIALAIDGSLPLIDLPGYIIAQMVGAFLGACLVYVLYKDHFDATEDPATKLGVFSTSPTIKNTPRNFLSEVVGTFILVFAIKGIGQVTGIAGGVSPVLVWGIICAVGMSVGGLTGFAINPARDLGPRIAHAVLPIKGKGSSNWGYAWVPVFGPIVGAIIGVGLYALIF